MEEPLIVGKSPIIKEVRDFIQKAACSDSNVLILGETGVGKDLVARSIHCRSPRKTEPFVKLNCASINENLLESELFGHRKGAFTGAITDKPGLIESAGRGTFFFDEIGDIGPSFQAKLLSAVEDRETRRIGENNFRRVHARFIFATNNDLSSCVTHKKFREDLYYRINILNLYIGPLRARKEDLGLLVEAFQEREKQGGSLPVEITDQAIEKHRIHNFPGNIRELESLLKRASILAGSNAITGDHIILGCQLSSPYRRSRRARYPLGRIIEALIECKGNKAAAAARLGMSRVHLHRLLSGLKEENSSDPFL